MMVSDIIAQNIEILKIGIFIFVQLILNHHSVIVLQIVQTQDMAFQKFF